MQEGSRAIHGMFLTRCLSDAATCQLCCCSGFPQHVGGGTCILGCVWCARGCDLIFVMYKFHIAG